MSGQSGNGFRIFLIMICMQPFQTIPMIMLFLIKVQSL